MTAWNSNNLNNINKAQGGDTVKGMVDKINALTSQVNALTERLNGGLNGQSFTKNSNDDGNFIWRNVLTDNIFQSRLVQKFYLPNTLYTDIDADYGTNLSLTVYKPGYIRFNLSVLLEALGDGSGNITIAISRIGTGPIFEMFHTTGVTEGISQPCFTISGECYYQVPTVGAYNFKLQYKVGGPWTRGNISVNSGTLSGQVL